jgi:hypothetical protein
MEVVIRFTESEECKALPILLRHSPGRVLPNRTYVIKRGVLNALNDAGVRYQEVTPRITMPAIEDVSVGERI